MFSYNLKKFTTPFFLVSLFLFLPTVALLVLCQRFPTLADGINVTVAHALRVALGSVSSLWPFSLAELIIVLSPLLAAGVIVLYCLLCDTRRKSLHFLANTLGVLMLVFVVYFFTLGVGYHATRLDERAELKREKLTTDELYAVSAHLLSLCEAELEGVEFDADGSSVMPYSMGELSRILCRDYDKLLESELGSRILGANFGSRVKGVGFSRVMSYLHILGIYTFFTGESNVNRDYPDVETPATTAHELAHQRGVSREDEANFVTFLVTLSSSDAYVRYSGAFDIFRYVSNALYSADPERYYELLASADARIIGEMRAISRHAKQFQGTAIGEVSSNLNDADLKANGTEGAVSYGFVVDLTVAYYKQNLPTLFE